MIPKNEQEVIYLFSRNHEKLGFEKIKSFNPHGFPDCKAIKDGKEVGIEFELESNKFVTHYWKRGFSNSHNYKIEGNKIIVFLKDNPNQIVAEFDSDIFEVWDPETFKIPPSFWIKDYSSIGGKPLVIKYKTRSDMVQYIICWEDNKKFDDKIEVLELKSWL